MSLIFCFIFSKSSFDRELILFKSLLFKSLLFENIFNWEILKKLSLQLINQIFSIYLFQLFLVVKGIQKTSGY